MEQHEEVSEVRFEGERVDRLEGTLNATALNLSEPLRLGDQVRVTVEAEVSKIVHTPGRRTHQLTGIEAVIA